MEFTTSIETVDSPLPRNINKLTALEIKKPCSVDRAYQLVEDYPNLASLKIAGSVHTRQEIKQLPFGQIIGGHATMNINLEVPPAPPAPALIPEPVHDIWVDEPIFTWDEAAMPEDLYTGDDGGGPPMVM